MSEQSVFPPFDSAADTIQAEHACSEHSWLVFGGPYSNLQATQALRQKAEQLGIPSSRVLCTGDVVAYCAQPVETVELIRDWGCHVIMGNCEESLAAGAEDCGCGFEEGTACSLLSDQWYRYSNQRVTSDQRLWMADLPRQLLLEIAGVRCQVIHGSLSKINEFVFSALPEDQLLSHFAQAQADVVISGHSGLPFTRRLGKRVWFNAGVIGMPADDGTPDVWFGLITPSVDGLRFTHHRLSYPAELAAHSMQQAGLINGYARCLIEGWWPSLDVLPPEDLALAKQRRLSRTN